MYFFESTESRLLAAIQEAGRERGGGGSGGSYLLGSQVSALSHNNLPQADSREWVQFWRVLIRWVYGRRLIFVSERTNKRKQQQLFVIVHIPDASCRES